MTGSLERMASHPRVASALGDCRRAFWSVALFSGVVNLLMLAGPLYMLQIYDRVLASRSVPTLVALSILLVGAFAFQGILDIIRSRVVVRAAALLDGHLATTIHDAVVQLGIQARRASDAHQPVRDLDQIRAFLTGAGPIAIVDLPWVPIFLLLCFIIHPWLGALALFGALTLVGMTLLTERASREPTRSLGREGGARLAALEADRRNSETITAMGMVDAMASRWTEVNSRYLEAVGRAADIVNSFGSASKVLRLLLQSGILGLGAYLVIRQELSPGAMIAASIMVGRALAPIETAIANWRSFVGARDSVRRLSELLAQLPAGGAMTALPKPVRSLDVQGVTVAPPQSRQPIISGVQFRLAAGEALGVIGPSGAGKSSVGRVIVGVWPPAQGKVRLDGATLDQWDPLELGSHIGYLSQAVELFDGTIAENIARMSAAPDGASVLRAAEVAGAHEMILHFPNGYDTRIGEAGTVLSAGQRQRIALARALYGDPFLVVLDEPNANLDSEGEDALQRALLATKKRGAVVLVMTHRPNVLAVCDKVLVLANGRQQVFGPRDETLRKVLVRRTPSAGTAGTLKLVSEASRGGDT